MSKNILLNIERKPYRFVELKLSFNKGCFFYIKEGYIKGKNISKEIIEFDDYNIAENFYSKKLDELKKINFFNTEINYLKSIKIIKTDYFTLIEDTDYEQYYTAKYIPSFNNWYLIHLKDFDHENIKDINMKINYLINNSLKIKDNLINGYFKTYKKDVRKVLTNTLEYSKKNKLHSNFDDYVNNIKLNNKKYRKIFKDEIEEAIFYKNQQLKNIEEEKDLWEEKNLTDKAKSLEDKRFIWDKYMKLKSIIIFNKEDYNEFGDIGFNYDYEHDIHALILTTKKTKFKGFYALGMVY